LAEVGEVAGFGEAFAAGFAGVLAEVAPILNERQRRVLLGAGARRLGAKVEPDAPGQAVPPDPR
jgi:hypothetical protein